VTPGTYIHFAASTFVLTGGASPRTSTNGTPIARPVLEAGDAMLFDHLLVHRTAVAPGMTRERHAIESWFFAPSAYPEGQLPILY